MPEIAELIQSVTSFQTEGVVCEITDGKKIYRWFADSERYFIDFADDYHQHGLIQYDTDQDAPYFGVWISPTKMLTLTYCEGDWSLVICDNPITYNSEVDLIVEFYEKAPGFVSIDIDEKTITKYYQSKSDLYLQTIPHEQLSKDYQSSNRVFHQISKHDAIQMLGEVPPLKQDGFSFICSEQKFAINGQNIYLACLEKQNKFWAILATLSEWNELFEWLDNQLS
ncbi:hypothetical protein [Laspinema olomoucense]|uniref:hypothetical protein n=1 Tax=Laspinema olomoucense TaxID=3231600 RepID=UPI0021BAC969|nr:hypothetical protein [Laspinema sp. D3c]MCT7992488.1 hypothetical protein [Laspinema sp. D3c]